MKRFLFLFLALMVSTISFAKSAHSNYEYDIVGVAIAKDGYYLVEVSAMVDKKKDATLDVAKKCAIHGCLFKGFAVDRLSQKPIMPSPATEQEHQDFFTRLLDEQYEAYTNCSHPIQIIKIGKRYKVKAIIVVAKDNLRKDLEAAGILRSLGL